MAVEDFRRYLKNRAAHKTEEQSPPAATDKKAKQRIQPEPCDNWDALISRWKAALKWRRSMTEVWSVALSVALSTEQVGDQLFLMIIGDAGSAKTRLCDAMLTSEYCHHLEHLTGFHSGYNDGSGKDFSLIGRMNLKTLITPEGDVLMSNPNAAQIMSQQRRIFDGVSGATYKNRDEDMLYTGLRTPWILAGTPALLDIDHARLGDRFLKVFVDPPTPEQEQCILRTVGFSALRSVLQRSNGQPESTLEESLCGAYKLTGGYVNHLRQNAQELLNSVTVNNEEEVVRRCGRLAEFAAYFRTQQFSGKRGRYQEEHHITKELPSRLQAQFVRLAMCLSVVLCRWEVDDEVMRTVTKVALDTGNGSTLNLAKAIHRHCKAGGTVSKIAILAGQTEDRVRGAMRFLNTLKVVTSYQETRGTGTVTKWKLTDKIQSLCDEVFGNAED